MLKTTLFIYSIISISVAGWVIETVDSTGDVGTYTSIALDQNECPHISYMSELFTNYFHHLKYAKWVGSGWQVQAIDTVNDTLSGPFRKTSIILDDHDNPHSAYVRGHNSTRTRLIKYAYWDGTTWDIQVIDTAWGYVSLALDNSGHPHLSYTKGPLVHARHDGTRWIIQNVDTSVTAWWTSIALDRRGYPHICYCNIRDWTLKYAKWDGSSWQIEIIDPNSVTGWHNSITLDTTGQPHVSYVRYADQRLKYAWRSGAGWVIEDIDFSGFSLYATLATSIELNDLAFPRIIYYNQGDNAIKYAYWDGSRWILEIVIPNACCGSLALTPSYYPRIACYDYQLADLIYAKWITSINEEINPYSNCELLFFSNPVTSCLSIKSVKPISGLVKLCLYNSSGQKVKELAINGLRKTSLNVTDLATGTYFLIIKAEGRQAVKKLVIAR